MDANLTSPPIPSSPIVEDPLNIAPSLLVQIAPTILTFALLVLPPLAYFTYKDYNAFLSLGPGGTPYNFYGYLKITFLRLVVLRDPCTIEVPVELQNTGYLSKTGISRRHSARPAVTGIAPHRQIDQRAQQEIFACLSQSIMKLAVDHPQELRIAKSTFEKHCPALFSNKQINTTKEGEVCHAHSIDGSLHMTLHPEDVKTVIDAGWGERHPLARGGWCQRFVPSGFMMVYAPRTEEEVDTVMSIIKAGICWVRNERFFDPDVQARYAELHLAPLDPATADKINMRCGAVAS